MAYSTPVQNLGCGWVYGHGHGSGYSHNSGQRKVAIVSDRKVDSVHSAGPVASVTAFLVAETDSDHPNSQISNYL